MKKAKRFLATFLAVTLIICSVSCLGLTAFAEAVTSGTCGKNLTWKYNTETYTLEISGSGVMNNYSDDDGLTTAPWNNFYNRMKTLIIGDSVTSIGSSAFCGCTGLTSIEIPDSVTSIGNSAFSYCTGLKSIEIPISVTSIGSSAFSGCTGLTSIEIPDSVTSIGNYAFRNCTGLKTVTIGNSVTSIGSSAFESCTGLTSIEIPDSVTSIGSSAFYSCTGLNTVTIGNSVTSIGSSAFYSCTELTSIEIPNSVTSIGYEAFGFCTGLTSIEIPDSVTSIGSSAFEDTAWYNSKPNGLVYAGKVAYKYKGTMPSNISIVLKDGTLGISGSAFSDCYGLTSIEIPDSVTSIDYEAFSGCPGLTSIEIPDSVTSIGDSAFSYCTGLKTVTIGNSVESIGNYAFEYCIELKAVKYLGTKQQWDKIKIGEGNQCLTAATLETNEQTKTIKNLTCTAYTKATLTLSWDKVDGVKGYRIYCVQLDKTYKVKGADVTSYKIQNLKECKNYDFSICYFVNNGNGDIYSEYSESFRYCTRPSGVTVTEINNSSSDTKHSFTVTHSTVKNVSGYEIKYQLVGAKNYKTYNRTAHTAKTVEVAKAGTYKVWIRAYKSAKYDGVNKFKANGDWSESYTVEVK